MRTIARALIAGLAALTLGPATHAAQSNGDNVAAADMRRAFDASLILQRIEADFSRGAYQDALAGTQSLIDAKDFADLTTGFQHDVHVLRAAAALRLGDATLAKAAILKATSFPEATARDWISRLGIDAAQRDGDDLVQCYKTLAAAYPETLRAFSTDYVGATLQLINTLPEPDAHRFDIVDALDQAGWVGDPLQPPASLWARHAAAVIDKGQAKRAEHFITKAANDPYVVAQMRADKRFDAFVTAHPETFDPEAVAGRRLDAARADLAANPKRLRATMNLALALLALGRADEAIAATDAALAKAMPADGAPSPYTDSVTTLNWVMDTRYRALDWAGRANDAVEQARRAAKVPERGQMNVSQSLNLAALLVSLDQPKQALAELKDVPPRISAFGRMTLESIRACATLGLGDTASAAPALTYLRDHANDAVGPYLDAMICANDLDGAARFAISRLNDPNARLTTLLLFQQFTLSPRPQTSAYKASFAAGYAKLRARPDVKAALDAVGRINTFKLAPPPT